MAGGWDGVKLVHVALYADLLKPVTDIMSVTLFSLMLDELEKVLYFDTIEQCLSYDTTFQQIQ